MKKIITTLLFTALALCIAGCGISLSDYRYDFKEKYSAGDKSFTEKITALDIDWLSGSVCFEYHDKDTIEIAEEANVDLTESTKMHWYLDGETLFVRYSEAGRIRLYNMKKNLKIILPKNYRAEEIELSLTSSTLNAEKLCSDRIDINTASGSIHLTAEDTKDIEINSASGTVCLTQKGESDRISIDTASGAVDFSGDTVARLDISTSSGRIDSVCRSCDDADISSSSGNIRAEASEEIRDTDLSTSSGKITLIVPENTGFTASVSTSSGKVNYTLPLTKSGNKLVYGDGGADIRLETSSGNISIENK